MPRMIAYILILLIVLAGCGGPPKGGDSSTAPELTSSPSGSPSSSSEQGVPTEPVESTVPAESDRPTDGGDGGGGREDERGIELGGPTVDNTYPLDPWALHREGMSSCVLFTNRKAAATVTVHSVRLVDQQPPNDPGLALGDNPSAHRQCNANQAPLGLEKILNDCTNAQLEPKQRTGCPVEVQSIGTVGTDYTARLVLQLSATCTSLAGQPCARLTGHSNPTATKPVTMSWTDERFYSSCLIPRQPGEWGEAQDGECPPVDATSNASPSESEPGSEEEPGSGDEPGSEQPGAGEEEGQPPAEGGEAEDTAPTPDPTTSASADDG